MALGSESVDLEGDVGSYTGFDSSVDAVVDWFGPIDFPSMDSCGSSMVHNAPDSPESILIGGPIQDHRERCALANPMTYIDALDPPFLILHGDKDPLVPHCQSAMLHDALKKAGVPSEYKLVPNAKHGPGLFEEKYFQRMGDFFQAALKEKQKSQ
jgi:acetyl esterase/lipase